MFFADNQYSVVDLKTNAEYEIKRISIPTRDASNTQYLFGHVPKYSIRPNTQFRKHQVSNLIFIVHFTNFLPTCEESIFPLHLRI